ncbi:MAG: glycosyltransferase [Chloroflexota bacterium]
MRVALLTYGSRGDVQPFVALGVSLKAAGHQVRLAAPGRFAAFVTGYGLEFHPLPGDPAELSRDLVDKGGGNFIRLAKVIRDYAEPIAVDVYNALDAAADGADALVYSFLIAVPCHHIARERGIPDFSAQLQPIMMPTGDFPSMLFPRIPVFRRWFNRLTHQLFIEIFWQTNRLSYHLVRRGHPELPKVIRWPLARDNTDQPPVLYAFSPTVLPRPADWSHDVYVSGYWSLDAPSHWQPPVDLVDFINDGPPPVYIGFGSMISHQMERYLDICLRALRKAGRRGILAAGWTSVAQGELGDDVLLIEEAPHSWLLPQMAAVVHHGGAGTTGAGLRAGVPSIVVPFFGDQFFWGARVHHIGAGPAPIPNRKLDVDSLAIAIHTAATYPPLIAHAASIGRQIQAEEGTHWATRFIEGRVARMTPTAGLINRPLA